MLTYLSIYSTYLGLSNGKTAYAGCHIMFAMGIYACPYVILIRHHYTWAMCDEKEGGFDHQLVGSRQDSRIFAAAYLNPPMRRKPST